MRLRPLLIPLLVALVALAAASTACSSSAGKAGHGSPTNVVDGITIPPPYVPPPVSVAAGPTACPASFLTTLRAAPVAGSTYSVHTQRDTDLLTCRYQSARPAAGHCSRVVVSVNTEPQAFKAFDRWNVETGQNAMWSHDPKLAPVPVAGVGIQADWVPRLHELGAASSTTWVAVVLTCPTEGAAVLTLAKALATDGLASTG